VFGQHARDEALISSKTACLRRNLSLVTSAATIYPILHRRRQTSGYGVGSDVENDTFK